MEEYTEIRDGWLWPKDDIRCWRCFFHLKSKDLPSRILQHVNKKSLCVQAGGNVGVYVKEFAGVFQTVHTFEPEPLNFYCLKHNLKDCKNVILHQGFVSDKKQPPKNIVRFDTKKDPNTGKFKIGEESGNISVFSIDEMQLESCDLIQLDIEGNEPRALIGAMETIKKHRPVICLEWFDNQEQLLSILEEINYRQVADFGSDRVFVSN